MAMFYKDTKAVKIAAAVARGEKVDSNQVEDTNKLIADLCTDLSPTNKYHIGQMVGFVVNEILQPRTNWIDQIADTKRIPLDGKAEFSVKLDGIKAYIQAKGSTTARSKIAGRKLTVDTVEVSSRPVVNIVELQHGLVAMSELVQDAATQMELQYYGYLQMVLQNAMSTLASPYYATGAGLVKPTLDPMIRHWMRMGGAALLGDIAVVSKLADLTGFTAAVNTRAFSDGIIDEQNRAGYIGVYNGAKVINLMNPYRDGSDATVFDQDKLFILPTATDTSLRPLKYVIEGDVSSMENTNIDDKTFEIRLDQNIGAAVIYGDRPYISMYEDTTI